jgi:hypothetical protein
MIEIEWWVYLAVFGGLIVGSLLLHVGIVAVAADDTLAKQHGLAGLFIGVDNRTSTSKLQALLWTYAILWALLSVLFGAGVEDFDEIIGDELRDEYLLLLGGPYAVAIGAKAITTYNVNRDKIEKPQKKQENTGRVDARLAEVVTNDQEAVDLGDFQYVAFTVLTLGYFAWAFIDSPGDGLPPIPGTLLVLMGVSQATYLAKKGLVESGTERDRAARAPGVTRRRRRKPS